jgi:hypothetical protein
MRHRFFSTYSTKVHVPSQIALPHYSIYKVQCYCTRIIGRRTLSFVGYISACGELLKLFRKMYYIFAHSFLVHSDGSTSYCV